MKKRLFIFLIFVMAVTAASQAYAIPVSAMPSKSDDGATIYNVVWTGDLTTTYTATPYTGLTATYTDNSNVVRNTTLTFSNGTETFVSPNAPTNAGVYTVTAHPIIAGDSLNPSTATVTLLISPAHVTVENSIVVITKFYDGNDIAEVTSIGTLDGILGSDVLTHTVEAHFDSPNLGSDKDITITYTLAGSSLPNYELPSYQKVLHNGAIIEDMRPDTNYIGTNGYNQGLEVEAYGYCSGSGSIEYHLISGNPDQYRLTFDDPSIPNVNWKYLSTPGPTGTININIPAGIPTGDYTATLTFRDHNYPTLISPAIRVSFHVNLPETYVMPLFDDVIALIDTCQCLTDIQWYHREYGETQWTLIPGANDYYYQQEGGLTGEYFVSCRMNGVETYTCPQQDMNTLVSDDAVSVKAYPNPTAGTISINVSNSDKFNHTLRVSNTAGVVIEERTFNGNSTTLDMSRYQHGSYIVSVDGAVQQVIRK
ncbi:MAG: T9SS type A sorting domain-containing protein [Bacteroidales bacterium]|nr:T9SS type A sorting domain-containing protein [Bacteroidales bacterium]